MCTHSPSLGFEVTHLVACAMVCSCLILSLAIQIFFLEKERERNPRNRILWEIYRYLSWSAGTAYNITGTWVASQPAPRDKLKTSPNFPARWHSMSRNWWTPWWHIACICTQLCTPIYLHKYTANTYDKIPINSPEMTNTSQVCKSGTHIRLGWYGTQHTHTINWESASEGL